MHNAEQLRVNRNFELSPSTREHTKTKTTRRIDGEHSFSREFHITRFAITFVV
jgi:hypothetical protein